MSFAREWFRTLVGKKAPRRTGEKLHATMDYLDAYAANTNERVATDPKAAIGGSWDEIGQLQLEFLLGNGLEPHHALLDIGCGTLRAGRHFIRYLASGKYTGFDISSAAIDYGHALVRQEGLEAKAPALFVNVEKTLRFDDLHAKAATFDFLIAQSVFTHLPAENVAECLQNVPKVMHGQSKFFFTYFDRPTVGRLGMEGFGQTFPFLAAAGADSGLALRQRPDYRHPRGQTMVETTLA
jgi:SAM-dependent methyltransferase